MKIAFVLVVSLAASATSQTCGRRNGYGMNPMSVRGGNYIVGGDEALPHEFPWQISFQIRVRDSLKFWKPKVWRHNCGGSIINDEWILTAAHCHVFSNTNDYRIVVGAHNVARNETTTQTFGIKMLVLHPYWNDKTIENDIMLIKLAGKINLDSITAAPICLPSESDSFTNSVCVTSGWGKTTHGGIASPRLLKVDLPIVPNLRCSINYRNVYGARIDDTHICAGELYRDGKGVCQGDSGGPLACFKNGAYTLAGITSFGVICGSSEHPAVYTRVSEYRRWIDRIVDKY